MSEAGSRDVERFLAAHGPFEAAPAFTRGDRIGDWQVLAFLGRGATSEVYRAENTVTRQIGAVKVLMRGDENARARFRREIALLANTGCAALPRFYGAGEHCGHAFLATEQLDPVELPSSDAAIARFVLGVCEGVSELHARGYVHRDIKPCNVMRRPSTGEPVLIDMGLAKEADKTPNAVADTLSVVDGRAVGVGTVGYSAPEQFSGGKISAAADVHALGMLANACYKSRPPRAWAEIIRRSTSSAPEQRYATVVEFERAVRTRNRTRHALMAVAAVCVVVTAVIVGFSRGDEMRHRSSASEGRFGEAEPEECPSIREAQRNVGQPDTGLLRQEGRVPARPNNQNHVEPSSSEPAAVETADDLLSLGKSRIANGDRVTTIELRGRDIVLSKDAFLTEKQKVVIVGPGRLTGAISGACGASLELSKRAMLINLTTTPYPASAMKFILTGDAYLNFKNLDAPLDGDIKNVWIDDINEKGTPIVRFCGSDNVDYEEAKAINDAAWSQAIKSGGFW